MLWHRFVITMKYRADFSPYIFKVKFKATFFHKDDLEGVNIDSMDCNVAAVGASAAP